jgi:hypothetical protein
MSCPYWESNPGHPACTLSLYRLNYLGSHVIFHDGTSVSDRVAASFLKDEVCDLDFMVPKTSDRTRDVGVASEDSEGFCLLECDASMVSW